MLTRWEKKVLNFVKKIPKGKVMTYAALAKKSGNPRAYRAVGHALHKNPNIVTVPCHRVVRSTGDAGEYALGKKKKVSLLRSEGIKFENAKKIFEKYILS